MIITGIDMYVGIIVWTCMLKIADILFMSEAHIARQPMELLLYNTMYL